MNYIVKCSFCPTINLEYGMYMDDGIHGLSCYRYVCPTCKCCFLYRGEILTGWHFAIMGYKGKDFYVTWTVNSGYTDVCVSGKLLSKPILKIPGRAPFTPHNMRQKLPTILTFL